MTTIRAILCSSPLAMVMNHSNRVASECQCSQFDGATRLKFGVFRPPNQSYEFGFAESDRAMAGGDLATSSRWTHSGQTTFLASLWLETRVGDLAKTEPANRREDLSQIFIVPHPVILCCAAAGAGSGGPNENSGPSRGANVSGEPASTSRPAISRTIDLRRCGFHTGEALTISDGIDRSSVST